MTYQDIAQVIERDYPLTGRGRYRRSKEHNSLVVDTEQQRYYWNALGESGNVADWLRRQGRPVDAQQFDREEWQARQESAQRRERARQRRAVEEVKALGSRADYYHSKVDQARPYWHSQGLTDETIERYNLGYCDACPTAPSSPSFVIPYYQHNELVHIRHRLAKPQGGKYRPEFAGLPNQLFNVDRLKRKDGLTRAGEAVIVEGEVKTMVLDQAGIRVIGLPGANAWPTLLDQLKKVLRRFSRVYIAFDPGAEAQAAELATALGYKGFVRIPPGKPDDLLVKEGWTPERLYREIARPGPKEDAQQAEADRLKAEAKERQQAKETAAQARAQELDARWAAGDVVAFVGDEPIDPDLVAHKRAQFTNARKWADYCRAHWPDLDADLQYKIKLAENREARPARCGEIRKKTLPTGEVVTTRWTCGLCDNCLKRSVDIMRRALCEIQGIEPPRPYQKPIPLEELQTDDLTGSDDDDPRENAPPLAKVEGELSVVRIEGDDARLKLARELRTDGVLYRCQPVTEAGPIEYDYIVNDDRGEPLELVDDDRIKLWIRGAEGKRASGQLLPCLKRLEQRYREALPFEVVLPELDDEGQPVDPDIFYIDLPDIGTTAILPAVVIDFDVTDRDSLQAALVTIHAEQWKILGRRGDVSFSAYIHKRFYTRYSTLPQLLARFNANMDRLREKERLKNPI